MKAQQHVDEGRTEMAGPASPTWWVVFKRELADQWIAGKALYLTLIYTVALGVMTYLMASNSELSLIPPKEMVYETLKIAMGFALFIGLIIGADSLSGDRERATLEGLLLTPTSRRQIVVGKFLAAVSVWPVALAIAIPYLKVLSQGDEVLGPAILWGAILGSLMAPAYTGLGMLVSFWSSTNKTSYFVSMAIYIFLLVPAQLPGRAQTGAAGQFVQWINPLAATNHFLSKHLVNYRPVSEFWNWLTSPVVFAVLVLGVLFLYAAPGLRLDAGRALPGKFRSWSKIPAKGWGRAAGLLVIAVLLTSYCSTYSIGLGAVPAMAFEGDGLQEAEQPLQIAIDTDYEVVKTGDKVEFSTKVTNNATEESPPLIVAMNIINLDRQGDVVDPEDWSPQRTQYLEKLAPGESASLSWIINTILDGNYMIYMVVIPEPSATEATSLPVASPGIHLTVTPFTRLNPGGVLPYAIGGPILLGLGIYLVYRLRRRQIDAGAPPQ
jgi:ABC-type transport system involved in cytochrome c biogenesis permease component